MTRTGTFRGALIEQQLRKELLRESRDLRTVLLARAMASTLVETSQTADETLSNPAVSADTPFSNDILKGWFEQNADDTV